MIHFHARNRVSCVLLNTRRRELIYNEYYLFKRPGLMNTRITCSLLIFNDILMTSRNVEANRRRLSGRLTVFVRRLFCLRAGCSFVPRTGIVLRDYFSSFVSWLSPCARSRYNRTVFSSFFYIFPMLSFELLWHDGNFIVTFN